MIQRFFEGWAFGVLTLLAIPLVPTVEYLGYWPAPRWTALLMMAVLLAAHLLWGAQGYYPRQI